MNKAVLILGVHPHYLVIQYLNVCKEPDIPLMTVMTITKGGNANLFLCIVSHCSINVLAFSCSPLSRPLLFGVPLHVILQKLVSHSRKLESNQRVQCRPPPRQVISTNQSQNFSNWPLCNFWPFLKIFSRLAIVFFCVKLITGAILVPYPHNVSNNTQNWIKCYLCHLFSSFCVKTNKHTQTLLKTLPPWWQ